ncbi:antibiotic ABC transporter ATP-binding protein [Tenacibaculum holothuriorum]|uniref:Antibiotic ABC transporter ATP-binding protein n=1 Tax=Tenacibaculum holothuriorum TaxID=1635173 RepID=A0A1Y2PFF9_9FLAO|nr:ABC transporter ATP-binding protein [Tenacibaculum holothuriorum]OSY89214.1 antibiotic ABC transporter ATP-binding protein [Tenacibaculum holothuriorum]
MSPFRKIIRFVLPYKKYMALNILFNVLYAIFNVLSVLAFIPLLGILFGKEEKVMSPTKYEGIGKIYKYVSGNLNYKLSQLIDAGGVEQALLYICGLTLILFLGKNIFRYLASYVLSFLQNGCVKDIRNEIYAKFLELPLGYFSDQKKGDLIARTTSDVQEVEVSFLNSFEALVREPLTIVLTLISMLAISVKLTLFVFILLPISGYIISAISKKLKHSALKAQKEMGNTLSILEETIGGLKIIKGFTAEDKAQSKFEKSTYNFYTLMNGVIQRKRLASPTSEFLGTVTIVIILWFGGKLVLGNNSSMQPQEFFGYIGLFYLILNPAKAISAAFYGIQKGNASAQRILEILEAENPIKNKKNATIKEGFNKQVEFKNIWFKYKDEYVLKDFSLKIPKGESVALVGQSGSGKSTLANLLTRFYDVNKGEILIDGVNIKDISKHDLRQLMGIVTQDSILFNDTVYNNISLGTKNTDLEKVTEASNIANAHEFIKDLPEQYNTNIGDSGNMLSGGQKQRLSIARAVLKNPPIMILDEATSALDTESEQLVQTALDKMMENRTSLVIAHRLSTIQKADNIVVLRKGQIVEQGKHQELLDKKGEYFKLVTMQSIN